MKPCPDFQETLLLDVHGELDHRELPAWEKHLKICRACRQERKKLVGVIQTVKSTMPCPKLSQEKAGALAESILQKMRDEQNEIRWGKQLFGAPKRLAPALVLACLLIVALSWVGLKQVRNTAFVPKVLDLFLEEQIITEDLEVIKNLELLQEMEALENLVEFLDKPQYEGPATKRETKIYYGGVHV